jgi:hypothetical protein
MRGREAAMAHGLARIGVASLVVLLEIGAGRAWAQDESFAKTGPYLGVVSSLGTTFEGNSFDGQHFLYDASQIVLIPRLGPTEGLGLVVGGRSRKAAIELSYVRAEHSASFDGSRLDVRSHVVNVDGKRFFASRFPAQPYISGGLAIPWIDVKDGSATMTSDGNATLLGVGFNVGAGVAIYPNPRVGLTLGYNYRVAVFPRVKGATGSFIDIDDRFEPVGRNGQVNLSASFTF